MTDHRVTLDTSELVAVLDTNVVLDIFSCHDVSTLYDRLGDAPSAVAHPAAVYRRARARESLLLAIYFNATRAKTYSAHEPAIIVRLVDPDAVDTIENHFTTLVAHFVKDTLLPDWQSLYRTEPDEGHGSAVDRFLLSFAEQYNLPLITNEGFTETGVQDLRLRALARERGVAVCTPSEFYRDHIDEQKAARNFIAAFRTAAPDYIQRHAKPEIVRKSLVIMAGYYRHILFGETEGLEDAVQVSV